MSFSTAHARAGLFILAGVCFLLPFVTVSCPAERFTFTGVQLATGLTVQAPQMFGPARTQRIPAEPLAIGAFLCVAGGILTSRLRGKLARLTAWGFGGGGALLLLLLKEKLDGDVQRQGAGLMQLQYEAGYWLALLSSAAAAVHESVVRIANLNVTTHRPESDAKEIALHTVPAYPASDFGSTPPPASARLADCQQVFCEQCGAKLRSECNYCPNCGAALIRAVT